jgi:hypothetical protein
MPWAAGRRHVKRWIGATGVGELSSLHTSLMGRIEDQLDTYIVELVGREADRCLSQADLVDGLTRLVNLGPAARMNELIPWLLGGGRSRGQDTPSLRPLAENPAGRIVGPDDRFQLVLASPLANALQSPA